jgi:hypothetical protein
LTASSIPDQGPAGPVLAQKGHRAMPIEANARRGGGSPSRSAHAYQSMKAGFIRTNDFMQQ